ncbi:lipoprotein-releasing system permease protein [Larkinella arboricola]|uniref:Lipoprotein-releasing system permease protein n=1 Tax=Larkinella arboricola TaxID=643671 RepID=A0A327X0T8_LARAB|nr:FtsX-like permease family protein [Larkinella arboricola]RAJ99947.1 lipoprotein-releasing system permease protein [Larkinella arboricola]
MNLPLWIARRYFFSKRKRSFINLISLVSMLGVGVGTMALVVVLSVFNGMEELNRMIFKTFEADLTISPAQGKRLTVSPGLLQTIQKTGQVHLITQVIEDNALARYRDGQTVVKLKGIDNSYLQRRQLDTALVEGRLRLQEDGMAYALVAEGVRNALLISPEDPLTLLELWYPQNRKSYTVLSADAFNRADLAVSGVFFIEDNFNDYVLAPLNVVRELVGYEQNQLSSLELQIKAGVEIAQLKKTLQQQLGGTVVIKDRDDLNPDLFRAIRVEKLFVTVTLAFLVLVASINIFFSLSMLAIEKKDDVAILYAMGASPSLVRRIFLFEGSIVAFIGAIVGLVLGIVLCLLQQRFGFVSMGIEGSLIDAYPVKLQANDLIITTFIVITVTIVVSWFPAQKAAAVSKAVDSVQ